MVPGDSAPPGRTDTTVPDGCSDVATLTSTGRRPSCRKSAITSPVGKPMKAAGVTAIRGTDGDTALLGAGPGDSEARISPARHPMRPTSTRAEERRVGKEGR